MAVCMSSCEWGQSCSRRRYVFQKTLRMCPRHGDMGRGCCCMRIGRKRSPLTARCLPPEAYLVAAHDGRAAQQGLLVAPRVPIGGAPAAVLPHADRSAAVEWRFCCRCTAHAGDEGIAPRSMLGKVIMSAVRPGNSAAAAMHRQPCDLRGRRHSRCSPHWGVRVRSTSQMVCVRHCRPAACSSLLNFGAISISRMLKHFRRSTAPTYHWRSPLSPCARQACHVFMISA